MFVQFISQQVRVPTIKPHKYVRIYIAHMCTHTYAQGDYRTKVITTILIVIAAFINQLKCDYTVMQPWLHQAGVQ